VSTRSWWAWDTTDRALPDDECVALAALLPGLPDRPSLYETVRAVRRRPAGRQVGAGPGGHPRPRVLIDTAENDLCRTAP
jgi:hypothetical protein